MDLESGSYPLDMQAKTVANNVMNYSGNHPCPTCGLVMNPVVAMYSKGMCPSCYNNFAAKRLQDRMM